MTVSLPITVNLFMLCVKVCGGVLLGTQAYLLVIQKSKLGFYIGCIAAMLWFVYAGVIESIQHIKFIDADYYFNMLLGINFYIVVILGLLYFAGLQHIAKIAKTHDTMMHAVIYRMRIVGGADNTTPLLWLGLWGILFHLYVYGLWFSWHSFVW